jgi:hypothetical protein
VRNASPDVRRTDSAIAAEEGSDRNTAIFLINIAINALLNPQTG